MEHTGVIESLVSISILFIFLFLWGKVRIKTAAYRFKKAKKFIQLKEYTKSIKILENIGEDLKYDPEYWYSLAFALVGVGDTQDARYALEHVFKLDAGHKNGNRLSEFIIDK